jgi:hypothetical protein
MDGEGRRTTRSLSERGTAALLGLTTCLIACAPRPGDAGTFAGEPSVRDSLLVFPSGAQVATGVRSPTVHGVLRTEGMKLPVVVVSGWPCEDCDAPKTVFLELVARRRQRGDHRGIYAYPGRQFSDDEPGETPIVASRLFFGACLPGGGTGVVQYVTEYEAEGPREAVHVSEVQGDSIIDRAAVQPAPPLERTVAQLSAGRCQEIAPEDYSVGP